MSPLTTPLPFVSEHLPDVGTDRGGDRSQRGVAGDLHPHHQQPEGHYLRVLQVTAQHNVSTIMAKHVYNVLLCNPDFFVIVICVEGATSKHFV